jgi:hypothetical protein
MRDIRKRDPHITIGFGKHPENLRGLKGTGHPADKVFMQITVSCHTCSGEKRPLSPCPWCSSQPAAEIEVAAWRSALHAESLARITAEPRRAPAPVVSLPTPIQVVVTVNGVPMRQADPIFSDAVVPASDPLSFDWNEDRGLRRLRRTA